MEHTIKVDALGNLHMEEGRLPSARLAWRADGHSFFLSGRYSGNRYELAANLVVSWCQLNHVNTFSLRRAER